MTDLKSFLEKKKLERAEKLKSEREKNKQFFHVLSTDHAHQPTSSAPNNGQRGPSNNQTKPNRENTALPRGSTYLCGILPLEGNSDTEVSQPITDSVFD